MEKVGEKDTQFSSSENRDDGQAGSRSEPVKSLDDPPVDWFEPLEEDWEDEDDRQSWDIDGSRDAEMESLAGESERSGSIAESERNYRGGRGGGAVRKRKRKWRHADGWEDCPVLGEGWKRKVVLRRSGLSVGQRDIYYLSPKGERVRSKIELLKYIGNTVDLTNFDFKTGIFLDGEHSKKATKKRKMDQSSPADCGFSSESSFHNDAAEACDRTYSPGPPYSLSHVAQQSLSPSSSQNDVPSVLGTSNENLNQALLIKPAASTQQNVPSNEGFSSQTIKVPANLENGPANIPSNLSVGTCVRCWNWFTGVEGQTMCEKCSKACNASKDNRKITFRKWLPCGFCRACQLTEDCGVCASCKNGKLNPRYRKPIRCRKRKCLCPSLKRRTEYALPKAQCGSVVHGSEKLETINMASKPSLPDFTESQYSDSDDQSSFYENDNEGLLRKFQRSCGRCKGCVAKADCGTCDYCIDKPKFGGSNKKRQKCRQRQCQREAKGWTTSRPHYGYSHKILKRDTEKWDFEFSDNECEKERIAKSSVVGVRYVKKDKHRITLYNGQDVDPEESQALSEDHLLNLFCDEWTRVSDKKWKCPPNSRKNAEEPDEDEIEPTTGAFSEERHWLGFLDCILKGA
ncbi:methyl-CpG-binding domain protein 1b isoform X2 [Tachysurus fulvidraco]|uniref:methyl-CpG-binding domain protein 1b isoform X2 n=1 Tax=Tachysurus fulvidraco TaxID=1234273 RepID=UPI000F4FBE17|nr:methyl-CpG-binding domain protein 1b isoform X2 [Tachysurus fulvidraco]